MDPSTLPAAVARRLRVPELFKYRHFAGIVPQLDFLVCYTNVGLSNFRYV